MQEVRQGDIRIKFRLYLSKSTAFSISEACSMGDGEMGDQIIGK